jgi:hypothetical protein
MIVGDAFDPMISQNIHISPKTIGRLLKEERLKVPPSQRSYRWKLEHVDEFFRDIRKAIDEQDDEYFLGSIVSINDRDTILIYDGQQRLATTMILIAAIRDYLLVLNNSEDADLVEKQYLFSKRRGEMDDEPHLTLNLEDRDFFSTRILPRPVPKQKRATQTRMRDSHKRMEAAAKHAKAFVGIITKGKDPADAYRHLNEWSNG